MSSPKPSNPACRYLFIVGAPRSGTTYLSRLLGSHPKALYMEEPRFGFFVRHVREWIERFVEIRMKGKAIPYWEASGDSLRHQVELKEFEKTALHCESAEHLRAFFRSLFSGPERLMIEKTPENTFFMEDLAALFPDAFFLHLVRDGRDFAASYVKRRLFKKWDVPLLGQTEMQFTAAEWRRYVEAAEQASANLTGRYRRIRYEDFIADPEAALELVLKALRLDWHADMTYFFQRGMGGLDRTVCGNYRQILAPDQILQFEQLAGDLLKRLNYPVEDNCRQGIET